MKQFTSRSPCLTFTHSRWRGDFSSRALAPSWAVVVIAANAAATMSSIIRFMDFPFCYYRFNTGNGDGRLLRVNARADEANYSRHRTLGKSVASHTFQRQRCDQNNPPRAAAAG